MYTHCPTEDVAILHFAPHREKKNRIFIYLKKMPHFKVKTHMKGLWQRRRATEPQTLKHLFIFFKSSNILKLITLPNPTPCHLSHSSTPSETHHHCSDSLSLSRGGRKSSKYLLVPMASISSMKTMEGACSSATRKSSRTSLGPSPRYFWISSEPTTRRKVADVWLATALASSVLPEHQQQFQVTQKALDIEQRGNAKMMALPLILEALYQIQALETTMTLMTEDLAKGCDE